MGTSKVAVIRVTPDGILSDIDRLLDLAGVSQADRAAAEEDFEGRKDDVAARSGLLGGGAGDYERDSEPPRP